MTTPAKEPERLFDSQDAFFFGGLAIAGAGGAMISIAWTLVIAGIVLALKGFGPIVVRGGAE